MVRSGIEIVISSFFCSTFEFIQGFRTLDDLRTKAKLSQNQQVGLKYYDEFLERMPRDEVTEIEAVVCTHERERAKRTIFKNRNNCLG